MMTSLKQNLSRTLGWLAVAAIRAYQVGLRPLNLWGCKFYPSCSHYALEAFEVHGPARGFWLTLKRLLRCRPGTFGGVDPVPAREEFSQDKIPANPVAEATGLNAVVANRPRQRRVSFAGPEAPSKRVSDDSLEGISGSVEGEENTIWRSAHWQPQGAGESSPAAPAAGNPEAGATGLNQKYLSSGSAHGLPPVGDTRTPRGRRTA